MQKKYGKDKWETREIDYLQRSGEKMQEEGMNGNRLVGMKREKHTYLYTHTHYIIYVCTIYVLKYRCDF